ncbi:MAG: ATP-dependent DNA helicase [Gammaproteobacteria bacterium]|nr:ATP-dependent DNA helicase [Gammaproteobacteria bacterium]
MQGLAELFSRDGALARRLPGYTYRDAQRQMAEIVGAAMESGRHVAIEAGTGIGKTFAYLAPALLSGRRAIISTGTRTLQDQLFTKDLPLLGGVIGRPVDVALLKGRNNYLCRHRLEAALAEAAAADGARSAGRGFWDLPGAFETLAELKEWGRTSRSGDLTELEDLPDDHALRGAVTSTVDNCLGSRCDFYDRCFVLEARRRAQAAQVVVVNHHLLLADLALKEGGFGELLPGADVVVVDEAHQLPDVAQQFFGVSLSARELEQLGRDVGVEARLAGLAAQLDAETAALGRRVADVRIAVAQRPAGRLAWPAVPPTLGAALAALREPLEDLDAALAEAEDASAGLARCRERCRAARARLDAIVAADAEEGLRWLEHTPRAVSAHWTPLDVGGPLAERIDAQAGAWVFASATLAVGQDFSHFLRRVGLPGAESHVLPSPFDYGRNARLYLPQGLPEPAREDYVDALMSAAWPLIAAAGGGAFLLFTSYRALHAAAAWIELRSPPGPVFVQGSAPRSLLLERFRAAGDAILLGTGSFWQGVDVRGRALRVVVIDKLPFASPGDPLVQARVAAIRRDGGDAFTQSQLPEAVLTLKQGVGRLIRDFDDRGLIVLGDPRLRTRPYGRVFLASLPAMPVLDEAADALAFAATLAAAGPLDGAPASEAPVGGGSVPAAAGT